MLLAFFISSCTPASSLTQKIFGSSSNGNSKVLISIPNTLSSSSSSSLTRAASITTPSGILIPSALSEFSCLAVNVIASDMPSTPVCGNQTNMGANAGFIKRGGVLEVDVPTGKNRVFQIWGFANTTNCPNTTDLKGLKYGELPSGATGPAFLLAEKAVDILQQTTSLSIGINFNLNTSNLVCGTLPTPETTISYAKIAPAEVVSVTSGSTITSTAELCIGFTTTAISPQFTCIQDGVTVPCSQGACASLTGGVVHRFTTAPLSAGTHTFQVGTTDLLYGLTDPTPANFSWTIDNTAPTFSITTVKPGSYRGADNIWYTSVTNPLTTLNISESGNIWFTINGGASTHCASPSFAGNTQCAMSGLTPGAANTIVFSAKDSASNAAVDITTTYTMDNVPPTLDITPTDHWLLGGDLTSAASPNGAIPTATDPVLGFVDASTLTCSVDSATVAACPSALTFSNGGRHLVAMNVRDYATNLTTFSNYVWVDSLLGQEDLGRIEVGGTYLVDESTLTTTVANQPLDNGLNSPGQSVLDTASGFYYVADTGNNRVLAFSWDTNSKSISSPFAVAVFGQPNFNSSDFGTANVATHTPMHSPIGVALSSSPKKLFVADTANHRVLRFDVSTGNANKVADVIFGQTVNTANTSNISGILSTAGGANMQKGLSSPSGIFYDSVNDRLYVADRGNCRIGVFGSASSTVTNGDNMTYQLAANGQGFGGTWNCAAPDAASAKTLNQPIGLWLDISSSKLYVTDNGNNRVAVWDTSTMAANPTADISTAFGNNSLVLGTAGDGNTAPALTSPVGVAVGANASSTKYLAVSASSGSTINKVKLFNLGTGDVTATWNLSGTSSSGRNTFNSPGHLLYNSTSASLYVSDVSNHRVGIFPATQTTNDVSMSDVIGHTTSDGSKSFIASIRNNPNDQKLNAPTYTVIDSTRNRIYVSDTGNNRILAYNLNSTNGKPSSPIAIATLGVPLNNSNGNTWLDSSTTAFVTSASTLNAPQGLALDSNGDLWVADSGNNRVVRFPTGSSSLTNRLSANVVLGQSSFSTATTGATASTLNSPKGVAYDSATDKLFVADTGNVRVQIFNTSTTISSGASATNTIGVGAGVDVNRFNSPENLYYTQGITGVLNKGLFVTDRTNHRVVYFDFSAGVPVSASACYGHHAGTVTLMCQTGTSNDGATLAINGTYALNSPRGVWVNETSKYLYIADSSNSRVVVFDLSQTINQPSGAGFSTSNVLFHAIGARTLLDFLTTTTATAAGLKVPTGITGLTPASGSNLLYIVDPSWHRVGEYEVP